MCLLTNTVILFGQKILRLLKLPNEVMFKLITIPPNENPPTAKCRFEKSTNCKVLDPTTHQLQCEQTALGGFFGKALRSWWIFIRRDRNYTSVDFKIFLFSTI